MGEREREGGGSFVNIKVIKREGGGSFVKLLLPELLQGNLHPLSSGGAGWF